MNLVHNERTKLSATYLNGVAIAVLAIGAFAPLVSYASAGSEVSPAVLSVLSLGCLIVSTLLHYAARRLLGRLHP
jgi:hypothetical protein